MMKLAVTIVCYESVTGELDNQWRPSQGSDFEQNYQFSLFGEEEIGEDKQRNGKYHMFRHWNTLWLPPEWMEYKRRTLGLVEVRLP